MNRWFGIGSLTRDPELRYTPQGKAVCSFRIGIASGTEEKPRTEYINCVAWEKLGEQIAERTRNEHSIFVEGRVQTRKYEKNGEYRYITEIVVSSVEYLDSRSKAAPRQEATFAGEPEADSFPF